MRKQLFFGLLFLLFSLQTLCFASDDDEFMNNEDVYGFEESNPSPRQTRATQPAPVFVPQYDYPTYWLTADILFLGSFSLCQNGTSCISSDFGVCSNSSGYIGYANFEDPLPPGTSWRVVGFSFTLEYLNCGAGNVSATLEELEVGSFIPPESCSCSDCPTALTFSRFLNETQEWTGYDYDDVNTLFINITGGTLCFGGYITVNITYLDIPSTTGEVTTQESTTSEQTTGLQTTGLQTTAQQTTGLQTTGLQTTALQTTDSQQTTASQTTQQATTSRVTTAAIAPLLSSSKKKVSAGTAVGITIGVLALVGIMAGGGFFFYRRWKKRAEYQKI